MPPGNHSITPMDELTGEGVDLSVNVNASILDVLAQDADRIRANGHELYIDFNHNDDSGAAGWVESFYWAGDDPLTGGIRANVKWSQDGVDALTGKKFKRFSPTFKTKEGKITGLGSANVGGLTNRPAFTQNQAVVAKHKEKQKMEPDEIKQIAAAMAAELGQTVKAAEDDKKREDELDALKAENEELKKSIAAYKEKTAKAEEEEEKRKDESAKSAVEKAIAAGTVAPKDDAKIAILTAAAKESPEAFEMLLSSKTQSTGPTQRIVPVVPAESGSGLTPEQQISAAVKSRQASHGESISAAFSAVQAERPELFS